MSKKIIELTDYIKDAMLIRSAGVPDFVFAEKHRPRGTQYLFELIHAIKNQNYRRFCHGNHVA
ncbi:hypothetical protein FACS1894162_3840 [Bacteroidia bacterium]|nr:hypothetical protein FACS1894162_3840 [Bacteroidia bacterium]